MGDDELRKKLVRWEVQSRIPFQGNLTFIAGANVLSTPRAITPDLPELASN
jgi:hypothetical protein